ncbi:ethanolamine utilization protein EutH [Escherichia coli]
MVGMTALAPVLAHVLGPVIIPVYRNARRKPVNVRRNAAGVRYGRLLPRQRAGGRRRSSVAILWVNSRVDEGPTIVFSIPVALGIIVSLLTVVIWRSACWRAL